MFRRTILAAAAAVTLAASLPATSAEIYTVGTGATYRPFEFQTPDKKIIGFDIDLVEAIAKAEGFGVRFINTTWSSIFASLDNGDRDIIVSGITITDKRRQTVDFSRPYFLATQLVLTQKDLKIKSLKEIKGPVAVVANSAGDIAASNAYGKASRMIRRFDNTPLALEELNNGGVDAAIGDIGVLQYYAKQNPNKHFNMAIDPAFPEQYLGIGVKKGNAALLKKINAGLTKVINSGEYNKIYEKWFSTKAPKLPAE